MSNSTQVVKTESFAFHTLDQLQQMTLAEVEALWELVPTERQRLYKAIYDRTRRDEGASSDVLESQMVSQLLARYASKGLVPVGSYWVPTPPQIQQAASANTEVARDEMDVPPVRKPSPVILIIGAFCVLLFGFLFMRGLSNKNGATTLGTATHMLTPTLRYTVTPTPIALNAQDTIIRGGDSGSSAVQLYPVNLRVTNQDEVQPRIFVVQRRVIQTTEWNYDDNPDTASYISGLLIRPVLGIPWSESNAVLFDKLGKGSVFTLQMNTGAARRFTFASKTLSSRSDTSFFQQSSPGLVLALIGERNPDTQEATPTRVFVLANYLPEQEFSSGSIAGMALPRIDNPMPTATATAMQRVNVQVISVESAQGWIRVHLRIFNGRYDVMTLDAQSIWLTYGYVEHPVGPHIQAELEPVMLQAGQAADLIVSFAWHGEPFATLNAFGDYEYALAF